MIEGENSELVLALHTLDPVGTRVVWPTASGAKRSVWVLREGGVWHAYENVCPHWRCPLDARPAPVVTKDSAYLACSVHGAEFRRRDGVCIQGPCEGDALKAFQTEIVGDSLIIRNASRFMLRLDDIGAHLGPMVPEEEER